MHCSHCSSLMAEIETQKDGRIEQSRYECPVCGREQLSTRTLDQWKDRLTLLTGRLERQALRYP
jgi:transcription elongation factor Elf1